MAVIELASQTASLGNLLTASSIEVKPTRRIVLLGASNLTRSFPTVVAVAQRMWGEPLEIMAAMGHGRSYGQDSAVFGRKISGIFSCALWQDLHARPRLPIAALVTDIGNDLVYGAPILQILDWVARCLDRLTDVGASTIVTELPIANIHSLSEARFQFFRWLFFPHSKLTLADARALAEKLNEGLLNLCRERKIPTISAENAWYGLDPIHLKRRSLRHAWPTLLAAWRAAQEPVMISRGSVWLSAYLNSLAPFEQSLFGVRRRTAQPCGRLADGTTISLY